MNPLKMWTLRNYPNRLKMMAISFGGPIVKDKVWFFTNLQMNANNSTAIVPETVNRPVDMQTEEWRSAYLFGKVTYRLMTRIGFGYKDSQTQLTSRIQIVLFTAQWRLMVATRWLAGILGAHLDPQPASPSLKPSFTLKSYIVVMPIQWTECSGDDWDPNNEYWCNKTDFEVETMVMVGHSVMTGPIPMVDLDKPVGLPMTQMDLDLVLQPYSYWTERRRHS